MAHNKFCFVNISGVTFCVSNRILRRHPYTKLAALFETGNTSVSAATGASGTDYESAVFFDRNPVIFSSILDFYRTGQLHIPHSFCFSSIQEELDFWRIDSAHLAECCAVVRENYKKNIKEIKEVQQVFGDDEMRSRAKDTSMMTVSMSPYRRRLNLLFNDTRVQKGWDSTLYFLVYTAVVVLHLISYIVQADYRTSNANPGELAFCPDLINLSLNRSISNKTTAATTSLDANLTTTTILPDWQQQLTDFAKIKYSKYFLSRPAMALRAIDVACMFLFGLDIVLRALSVQTLAQFTKRLGNWFDIVCTGANLLAFSISLRSLDGVTLFNCSFELLTAYLMLEIFRVLRLGRLLQFANKYNGIIVLLLTVRNSLYELGLLLAALGSGVFLFGFLVYIAELGNDASRITSFPVGFWWAVVTMTTLGYGDVYPATVSGYLIGSLCAISGVIFMAVQVPVIGNKFSAFYTYACEQAASKSK